MKPAPIVLFTYNRPQHTRQTLQSLKKNVLASDSELFIYIDGPKQNSTEEQLNKISEVKKLVREERWCKEVHIIESPVNLGLAGSVMKGVSEVVNKYGKVIVLEDDLVSDKYFLKFMNDTLELYEKNENVISVTGYIYPVKKKLPETYFLKGADCWGWATWKRGWDLFEPNGKKLLQELEQKNLTNDFDFYGTYPYTQMLRDQIEKKNSSWAILWYASAYLKNKLTLYPGFSLIQNVGLDDSGTHSVTTDKYHTELKGKEILLTEQKTEEDANARKIVSEYFVSLKSEPKTSFFDRIISKLKGS